MRKGILIDNTPVVEVGRISHWDILLVARCGEGIIGVFDLDESRIREIGGDHWAS